MANKFRYTNEKCPHCNNVFCEDDDIAVCPECGTPHHRACFKENGYCENRDRHGSDFRWEPENPIIETPHTAETDDSKTFGEGPNPFVNGENPFNLFPKELDEGVTTIEAAQLVQVSPYKYIQNFFYLKSRKTTFNWAAFFFAPYWFFYRKLPKLGVIFMAITLGLAVITSVPQASADLSRDMGEFYEKYEDIAIQTFETDAEAQAYATEMMTDYTNIFKSNPVGTALYCAQLIAMGVLHLIAGFKANKWYYNRTISKVREINGKALEPLQKRLQMTREGGISATLTLLAVLGYDCATLLVNLLFQYI